MSTKTKCVKQTSKKYTERPSPPYSASQCPGETKKGNNGKMFVSVPNKNGVYAWKPKTNSNTNKSGKPSRKKYHETVTYREELDKNRHEYDLRRKINGKPMFSKEDIRDWDEILDGLETREDIDEDIDKFHLRKEYTYKQMREITEARHKVYSLFSLDVEKEDSAYDAYVAMIKRLKKNSGEREEFIDSLSRSDLRDIVMWFTYNPPKGCKSAKSSNLTKAGKVLVGGLAGYGAFKAADAIENRFSKNKKN